MKQIGYCSKKTSYVVLIFMHNLMVIILCDVTLSVSTICFRGNV